MDHRPSLGAVAMLVALFAGSGAPSQAPFRFAGGSIPGEAGGVLGLADFDGDGDLDLLTNGTGIYLNDGHAHFTPHPVMSNVSVGSGDGAWEAMPVAIGDLNGDGLPDVLTYQSSGPPTGVVRWINQGGGNLVPASSLSMNAIAIKDIALGDVDGDGDLDAVIATNNFPGCWGWSPSSPQLWSNQGTGTFTLTTSSIATVAMSPRQIALADLDADGDLDLLTSGSNYTAAGMAGPLLFNNLGAGTFSPVGIPLPGPGAYDTASFSLGDVNGDGFTDILLDTMPLPACDRPFPWLLVNAGPGAVLTPAWLRIPSPAGGMPTLLDLDGTGCDDLVRITFHGITTHDLACGGSVGPPATVPRAAAQPSWNWGLMSATGDVDGDGDEDVVIWTSRGNEILFNDGAGQLRSVEPGLVAARGDTEAGSGSSGGDPLDWDGDGDVDLPLGFATCQPATPGALMLSMALNDGGGSFTNVDFACAGSSATMGSPREIADFDGDGDGDVVVATWTSGVGSALEVFESTNGYLTLTQTIAVPSISPVRAMRAGDIDGDGDLDLVVTTNEPPLSPGPPFVFKNGPAGLVNHQNFVWPIFPFAIGHDLELVDVDGDLDLDLVQASPIGGPPSRLALNNGTGTFTPAPPIPAVCASQVDSADVDLDGDADLLLNNAVLRNSGSGTFLPPSYVAVPGWPADPCPPALGFIDVDGDGDPDIVDSEGRLYRNGGGTPLFGAPEPLPSKLAVPIVHADFDGDGDEDLVARGPRILSNVTRHLAPGRPLRPGRPGSIEVSGSPGESFALVASTGQATVPIPPLGTVRLDLAAAQPVAAGLIGPAGTTTLTGITPDVPGIVGFTLYWQALVTEPAGPRLTGLVVTTVGAY
jgi:hypothetical protein